MSPSEPQSSQLQMGSESNDGRVGEIFIKYVSGLPGVVTVTASEENAAPAAAGATRSSTMTPTGAPPRTSDSRSPRWSSMTTRLGIPVPPRPGRHLPRQYRNRPKWFQAASGLRASRSCSPSRRLRLRGDRRGPPASDLRVARLGLDPQPSRADGHAAAEARRRRVHNLAERRHARMREAYRERRRNEQADGPGGDLISLGEPRSGSPGFVTVNGTYHDRACSEAHSAGLSPRPRRNCATAALSGRRTAGMSQVITSVIVK